MKRNSLWIFAAIAVVCLASLLVTLLSGDLLSKATGQTRNPEIENFDIRDIESREAIAKYKHRIEKFSSDQKQKSAQLKQAMASARERKAGNLGLKASISRMTNSPEIVEARGIKSLTPLSLQSRETMLRGFISNNADLYGIPQQQVAKLRKIADYTNPNGKLSWLKMEQRWNGMRVFRGEMVAAFTAKGELVRTVGEMTGGPDEAELLTTPKISAAQAVVAAAASVGITLAESDLTIKESSPDGRTVIFNPAGALTDDTKVELQYFALDARLATLAWSMVLWPDAPSAYYTLVDAEEESTGVVWRKNITEDQTQPATYVVYDANSPAPLGPSIAMPGSGIQGAAIPRSSFTLLSEGAFNNLGWLTDGVNTTTGNNVDAGLDIAAPNGIDPNGRPVGDPFRVFDFPYNPAPGLPPPGEAPSLANYRFGEVVHLFFWANRYHDRLYELGFTEDAGNFQNDNFGRGGLGNDRVLAEAQDSSGTNNANFSTPPDGSSGRMQMFIFTGPNPDRTSGLDQDVNLHELTHGTSNRLHNNASGLTAAMSRGMGEGWSDFYALSLLARPGDDPHGIYAAGGWVTAQITPGFTDNYYYGIRRFPYATISTVGPNGRPHNPMTFADIDPTQINLTDGAFPRGPIGSANAFEVHNSGEIWAMTLWEVRARIIDRMGFAAGNQRTLQLVTDGMKLDPVNPTFLDSRDSILAATCAAFGGEDELDIWAGFASRGMGYSARAVSATSSSVVEAFDMPNLEVGTVTLMDDSCLPSNGAADPGETVTLNIPLDNPFCSTALKGVTASVEGSSQKSYGDIPAGGSATQSFTFTVPADADCGSLLPVNVVISSDLGSVTRTFNLRIGSPVNLPGSFSTGNVATPIPDLNTLDIPFNVTDIGMVGDVNVSLRLNHTFDGDLQISLIGPDGTSVALATNVGGAGQNFGSGANDCSGDSTIFDDSASTGIAAGIAPFAGSFKPSSPLSAFNGKPATGAWILRITDIGPMDVGIVGCANLEVIRQRFSCCGVPGAMIESAPPATVVSESSAPGNGAPDPDETVTVNFPLRNLGTAIATNLVATLLPGGGVLAPSGPQSYGSMIPDALPAARPFTFTVAGACQDNLTATLALRDGSVSLGTVGFTMKIGRNLSFSNLASIRIPAAGSGTGTGAPAAPYPSTINVSGLTGTITKVTVQIFNFNFDTFPDDVDLLLVGPGGQKLLLMSDLGAGTSVNNANLTFDDAGSPFGSSIVSGTFRPTNSGANDQFPAPAPAGPYPDPQLLSIFNGLDPNGTWSLFAVDDVGGEIGNINGGWQLNFTTSESPCSITACALNRVPNIVVTRDPGTNGAIVNYPAPSFAGSCGVVTSDPPSGSFFPIGITNVMIKGTRQDGSTTTRPFSVTVVVPTTHDERAQTQGSSAASLQRMRK
jgi:extracellular elastinolytic metalloproteinase